MSGDAWIMLVCTWGVIIFFTARFFFLVLKTPQREDDQPGE